jgi:hypothetical protein
VYLCNLNKIAVALRVGAGILTAPLSLSAYLHLASALLLFGSLPFVYPMPDVQIAAAIPPNARISSMARPAACMRFRGAGGGESSCHAGLNS